MSAECLESVSPLNDGAHIRRAEQGSNRNDSQPKECCSQYFIWNSIKFGKLSIIRESFCQIILNEIF